MLLTVLFFSLIMTSLTLSL
uniref:Uncharacterized protein n=1 Tax=Anguilla anguilla TaxID=7936 RepID=A0A0E9XYE9_ANGAN